MTGSTVLFIVSIVVIIYSTYITFHYVSRPTTAHITQIEMDGVSDDADAHVIVLSWATKHLSFSDEYTMTDEEHQLLTSFVERYQEVREVTQSGEETKELKPAKD